MTNPQGKSSRAVDLAIAIDTSPSMKDQAEALSQAASISIKAAASSCPCDLRVAWFGIEGTWKNTNFNRTLRDYLLKVCKVSESQIRGRKRGEVASAGAQEDGARAIEDLANYFDWRPGAVRAIFYLGDEAVEGGGSQVTREDIEAANLAIKAAKNNRVKVHTYFGTSKGKHRDLIQEEYARIAKGTGGQSFTQEDTLKGFTAVLESVICGSRNVAESPSSDGESKRPVSPISGGDFLANLSFDSFQRDRQTDRVCVAPVRTIVRREEEIILVRKVRKVEEVNASPGCPTNTNQVSPS